MDNGKTDIKGMAYPQKLHFCRAAWNADAV